MKELERISRELEKSGKGGMLKTLADSKEGAAVSRMLDPDAVEKAARSGDMAALRDIISGVLSTEEGRKLAENVKKAMK